MLGGQDDIARNSDFDGRCNETGVGIKEEMVLEMPSENRQPQVFSLWGSTSVSEQLNIKFVTEACSCLTNGCSLEPCLVTLSVA